MVYGCAFWPVVDETEIAGYGFDDSKALTELKREKLFTQMADCGKIGWLTYSITAREISSDMLRRTPVSLNVISHDAAITMLELILKEGVRIEKVFVDTVGDPGYYQSKLQRIFNGGRQTTRGWPIEFTVSKKADSLYKTVSAASIAAKVTRDRSIRYWKFDEPALHMLTPPTDNEMLQYQPSKSGTKKSAKSKTTAGGKSGTGGATIVSSKTVSPLVDDNATLTVGNDDNDIEDDMDDDIGIDMASDDGEEDEDNDDDDIVVNARRTKSSSSSATTDETPLHSTTTLSSSSSSSSSSSLSEPMIRSSSSSYASGTILHPAISGSGYPSDPLTKLWLQNTFDPVFGWTSVTRFSWRPALNMIEEQGVPVEWGIEEDNTSKQPTVNKAQQAKFLSFFTASHSSSASLQGSKGRCAWLTKRHIEPVVTL